MKTKTRVVANSIAILAVALASLATSKGQTPKWEYTETSESHDFSVDAQNKAITFDIVATINDELVDASSGNISAAITVSSSEAATITGSFGDTQQTIELSGSGEQQFELIAYGDFTSCEPGNCSIQATLAFGHTSGGAASGSFVVTAELSGPIVDNGDEGNPPADSDVEFQITQQ